MAECEGQQAHAFATQQGRRQDDSKDRPYGSRHPGEIRDRILTTCSNARGFTTRPAAPGGGLEPGKKIDRVMLGRRLGPHAMWSGPMLKEISGKDRSLGLGRRSGGSRAALHAGILRLGPRREAESFKSRCQTPQPWRRGRDGKDRTADERDPHPRANPPACQSPPKRVVKTQKRQQGVRSGCDSRRGEESGKKRLGPT